MMKKIVTSVSLILIAVFTLISLLFFGYFQKEKRAIEIAKEYLNKKYSQPMTYEGVRFSVVDPSVYHVYFSPSSNSEILFEVIIQQDLSIEDTRKIDDEIVPQSADNYYIQFFKDALKKDLLSHVKEIFGENANINIVTSKGSYGYLIPENLNDTLSVSEMEEIYDKYKIYILIDEVFSDEESLVDLSKKTLNFIFVLKEKDYIPLEFGVQYLNSEDKKMQVSFGSILTINQNEQVQRIILLE